MWVSNAHRNDFCYNLCLEIGNTWLANLGFVQKLRQWFFSWEEIMFFDGNWNFLFFSTPLKKLNVT